MKNTNQANKTKHPASPKGWFTDPRENCNFSWFGKHGLPPIPLRMNPTPLLGLAVYSTVFRQDTASRCSAKYFRNSPGPTRNSSLSTNSSLRVCGFQAAHTQNQSTERGNDVLCIGHDMLSAIERAGALEDLSEELSVSVLARVPITRTTLCKPSKPSWEFS